MLGPSRRKPSVRGDTAVATTPAAMARPPISWSSLRRYVRAVIAPQPSICHKGSPSLVASANRICDPGGGMRAGTGGLVFASIFVFRKDRAVHRIRLGARTYPVFMFDFDEQAMGG